MLYVISRCFLCYSDNCLRIFMLGKRSVTVPSITLYLIQVKLIYITLSVPNYKSFWTKNILTNYKSFFNTNKTLKVVLRYQ